MQILSIHLQNIKSHRDTTLTFSAGINVLSGPNGIGKSTIFEAIGYALFGVDAQSFVGNVERFISIGAKRGLIEIEFVLNENENYRVTRTVGTPSKWLLAKQMAGEFEVEEHKDIKETEGRIKQLLGLDNGRALAEQFELVIGPFQHEFLGPFVIKQATKRRDKFDEILGIASWRKTFNETKLLTSAIKGKIDVLQAEIGARQEQVEVLPVKQQQLKDAGQQLTQAQLDFAQRQKELKQIEAQLVALDQREQALHKLQADIATHKERITNGQEKIAAQKLLIDAAHKAQQVISENQAGQQAFEKAVSDLSALQDQLKQQRQLEQQVAALDKQVAALAERHAAESRSVEQLRGQLLIEAQVLTDSRSALVVDESVRATAARLAEIRSAIESLRKQQGQLEGRRAGLEEGSEKLASGICPFFQEGCLNIADKPPQDVFTDKFADLAQQHVQRGQEIDLLLEEETTANRADEQLKEIQVKLAALEQQGASLNQRRKANEDQAAGLDGLQQEQKRAQQQLAAQQQALQLYAHLQADLERVETQKRQHQAARDLYVANQQQAAELEPRQNQLQKFEQFLTRLQGELSELEAASRQANEDYAAEAHQQLRLQKDQLRETVGVLRQKVVGLDDDQKRLSGEIDKLKMIVAQIEANKSQVKVYAEKDELVKFLRNKVFRNVSGYLSERFREEISLRADRIYRTIAEVDEELYWGENYQIVLRDLDDGEIRQRVDDQLSGGQIMSAVVALRLALLQTIGARIAFFDEPTSNLDAARRENLAHAFRAIDVGREEVTEHWYDQLFLISHDVAFTEVTDQIVSLEPRAD